MWLLESRNRYLEASTRRQLVSNLRETGSSVLASSMRIFSFRMRRRSSLYSMYALATSLCLLSSNTTSTVFCTFSTSGTVVSEYPPPTNRSTTLAASRLASSLSGTEQASMAL